MTSHAPPSGTHRPDLPCTHPNRSASCELLHQLKLTQVDDLLWRGRSRSGRAVPGRSFGGNLAAQSLLAAALTVSDKRKPNSLHMYFLSSGQAEEDLYYSATVLREGRSFSTRQVTVSQGEHQRAVALVSFHVDETSAAHQDNAAAVAVPPPGEPVPSSDMLYGLNYSTDATPHDPTTRLPTRHSWVRIDHELEPGSIWHPVMIAFITDIGMSRTVDLPRENESGRRQAASLDHAIWFHAPARADRWLYYEQISHIYRGARGVCDGRLYGSDRRLVASSSQEVLLRRV